MPSKGKRGCPTIDRTASFSVCTTHVPLGRSFLAAGRPDRHRPAKRAPARRSAPSGCRSETSLRERCNPPHEKEGRERILPGTAGRCRRYDRGKNNDPSCVPSCLPPRNVGKEIRDTRRTESGKRPRRTHALREQSPVSSIGSVDSAYSGIRAFSNAFRRGREHTGEVDDFRSQERARSLRNPSAKRTGLRCPEPRTARHPKARKPKNVPAGRMQFEKAGSLPKRENGSPKANHFVKPSAEPNSFELCRGEKWTKEIQRFR